MNQFKTLFILFLLIATIWGQNTTLASLIQMYEKKDLSSLDAALSGLKPGQLKPEDKQFFLALFIQDAAQAQTKFSSAFESASPVVKRLAAEKLKDYYYAIGYYVTATKYEKYLVEHVNDVVQTDQISQVVQPVRDIYFIQVGAFGLEANAAQRVQFLKTQDIESNIITRRVNDKTLYCVWIEADKDLDKSLEQAKKIKQKYDLEFQIMKK